MALFVFVFMAATLHSSFFKGFYYYSPWSEREIWPFFEDSNISETRMATSIKIGVHAFDIKLYLHDFF